MSLPDAIQTWARNADLDTIRTAAKQDVYNLVLDLSDSVRRRRASRRHDDFSVRAFAVKPCACGAPQKRRWGLTAQRGRARRRSANALTIMLRLITVRGCRTMSDRSSAGFFTRCRPTSTTATSPPP
jgi:hypothetical protein